MISIIEEIKKAANEKFYSEYALRIDDREYSVDETILYSRIWDDGEATNDLLNGTSCLSLCNYDEIEQLTEEKIDNITEQAKKYYGKHIYLVGGELEEYGNDLHEIVLDNTKIIEILK